MILDMETRFGEDRSFSILYTPNVNFFLPVIKTKWKVISSIEEINSWNKKIH